MSDPDRYALAVGVGLAPPLDEVEIVDRSTFRALRLVGTLPPGFAESDFQEVIDQHV